MKTPALGAALLLIAIGLLESEAPGWIAYLIVAAALLLFAWAAASTLQRRGATERLRAQDQRQIDRWRGESDERTAERDQLEHALAATGDIVLALDTQMRLAYLNPAARDRLPPPSNESGWIGAPLLNAISDPDLYTAVELALNEGAPAALPVQSEAKHYRAVVAPLPADGPWSVVLALHDLTDLHEAELARRDFFANASHELRTPLATIAAAAETLEIARGKQDRERFRAMILSETERISQLVEEMLALARLESGLSEPNIEEAPLAPLLQGALERIRPQAERGGIVLAGPVGGWIPPDDIRIAADPELVSRALLNLLQNAVKFTPAGGEVELSCEPGPSSDPAPMLWLRVRDTGEGVESSEQQRIFQRFYRVDRARRAGEGTGLGLAVVRHIAEVHGGAVALESTPGVGSTFSFSIPLAQRQSGR